jgi:hypothetical protein
MENIIKKNQKKFSNFNKKSFNERFAHYEILYGMLEELQEVENWENLDLYKKIYRAFCQYNELQKKVI